MPFADVNGIKIKYHIMGEGENLVFISGWGMDHKVWMHQMLYFRDKYRVIVFDNRGVGESTDDGRRLSTYTLAKDVVGLLDHIGVDRANVVGNSLGGMIAQEMAINFPKRVDKLILSSTTAKLTRRARRNFIKNLKNAVRNDVEILLDITPERPVLNRAINHVLKMTFSREFLDRNGDLIRDILRSNLSREGYIHTLVRQAGAAIRHDTRKRLYRIKSKTLVLAGENDALIPPTEGEELARGIKGSIYILIRNCAHSIQMEKPDEFNYHLENFLSDALESKDTTNYINLSS